MRNHSFGNRQTSWESRSRYTELSRHWAKPKPHLRMKDDGGSMKSTKIWGLVACLLLAAAMASAQGVGASGDLRGTVIDPSGAVVTKATVTATDTEKGIKRVAVSDSDGLFLFTLLPPTT